MRPCSSLDEFAEALGPISHYFGGVPNLEEAERFARVLEIERMHAAFENGRIVGGAGAFTFVLTVPGGLVSAAGITLVAVLPTHRRRGVLRAMMRAQLDDVRGRGEPVAYLWASEETIYGRYGYGMASYAGEIELPRDRSEFFESFERRGHARIVGEEEAYEPFAEVYDRVRLETPGMFSRTESWWRVRRLADPEHRRQGGGVLNMVLLEVDGRPEAYALYRMHQQLQGGVSTGHVNVIEALGSTAEGTREIWRLLLDVDWIASVKASRLPIDHPLFLLLARPRLTKFRVGDALWVRLVDVGAALAARRLGPGEPIVLEVADAFCPWNQGRWRVSEDGAERTDADADADLALDVSALGSVYLGGFTFAELARAGRVSELRDGAVARADRLFPADRAPWCPEIF